MLALGKERSKDTTKRKCIKCFSGMSPVLSVSEGVSSEGAGSEGAGTQERGSSSESESELRSI